MISVRGSDSFLPLDFFSADNQRNPVDWKGVVTAYEIKLQAAVQTFANDNPIFIEALYFKIKTTYIEMGKLQCMYSYARNMFLS